MKIAIVGSRSLVGTEVEDKIQALMADKGNQNEITVISGGALGVDRMAEAWARKNHAKLVVLRPDWNLHGMSAGFKRNTDIVANADEVIAIWDGYSRGTEDTITKAASAGKPVTIVRFEAPKTLEINEFKSNFFWLSNSVYSKITHMEVSYTSAEAAYWGSRAANKEEAFQIARLTPSTAAHEGRKLKAMEGWDRETAIALMSDILEKKFQHPGLKKLVEAGEIEVLDEGAGASGGGGGGPQGHGMAQGHSSGGGTRRSSGDR